MRFSPCTNFCIYCMPHVLLYVHVATVASPLQVTSVLLHLAWCRVVLDCQWLFPCTKVISLGTPPLPWTSSLLHLYVRQAFLGVGSLSGDVVLPPIKNPKEAICSTKFGLYARWIQHLHTKSQQTASDLFAFLCALLCVLAFTTACFFKPEWPHVCIVCTVLQQVNSRTNMFGWCYVNALLSFLTRAPWPQRGMQSSSVQHMLCSVTVCKVVIEHCLWPG